MSYFLFAVASSMTQNCADGSIFCMIGEKQTQTLLCNLMSNVFQHMAAPVPSSFFVDKHLTTNCDVPIKLISSLQNKRLGYSIDLKDKPLQSRSLNLITGGEKISFKRRNCSSKTELRITTKMFIFCSKLPKLDQINEAIRQRTKIIKFCSCFNGSPEHVQQNRIDSSLIDVIPRDLDYIKGFMVLLIEKLKELKSNNYKLPHQDSKENAYFKLTSLQEEKSLEIFLLKNVTSCPGSFISFEDMLARFMPGF
ncbi:hypothetical protein RF11_14865 [Thelohanellus kitauei]|uniref:Uncharacterized protein n=1 Tax=Thelohanellus kitauei TaxID=669202 RepID=A0A0C2N9G1_THEKT|nr:hypothetical protein RF11_14865 [Thelohanellus kitauei]